MDLSGKVIIITGGASGLGAATARAAAAKGAKVLLADIQDGTAVAVELGGQYVKCDVTNEADAKAVVAAASAMGELRGLINCAGVGSPQKVVGKEGGDEGPPVGVRAVAVQQQEAGLADLTPGQGFDLRANDLCERALRHALHGLLKPAGSLGFLPFEVSQRGLNVQVFGGGFGHGLACANGNSGM